MSKSHSGTFEMVSPLLQLRVSDSTEMQSVLGMTQNTA